MGTGLPSCCTASILCGRTPPAMPLCLSIRKLTNNVGPPSCYFWHELRRHMNSILIYGDLGGSVFSFFRKEQERERRRSRREVEGRETNSSWFPHLGQTKDRTSSALDAESISFSFPPLSCAANAGKRAGECFRRHLRSLTDGSFVLLPSNSSTRDTKMRS